MPVYHITLHAYRSWRPDHSRGYTRRKAGYQPSNAQEARKRDALARQSPAIFHEDAQRALICIAHDFCRRRKYRLHGVANEDGHLHLAMSWRGFSDWHEVVRRLKNVLATSLNKHFQSPGKRWFVRGASRKRVKDLKHLQYLIAAYFPSHSGIFWRKGQALPTMPVRTKTAGFRPRLSTSRN